MGKLAAELLKRGWVRRHTTEHSDAILETMWRLRGKIDLSDAQLAIMTHCARGDTMQQTARQLGLSLEMVKDHHKQIKLKLGAKSGPHAVAILITEGLITIEED